MTSFCLGVVLAALAASPAPAEDRSADVRGLQISLKSEKAAERAASARILGEIGPAAKEAAPALTDALKDPERDVRKNAAQALGYIGPGARSAGPGLIAALLDQDWQVRKAAAFALGRVGHLEAEEPLKKTRKDRVKAVQEAAKTALKDLKKFKRK
jgi:HEAT repeat protein